MHHRNRTPLRVSIVAIFIAMLMSSFLFGGMAARADEASQSAAQSAGETQSTTAQSSGVVTAESQSSSATTVAVTADNGGYSCTPQDISPGEVSTSFKTSDGSSEVTAFEEVEFSISLDLEQGHCGGDSVTINVPSELGTDGDHNTIAMTTPEGIVIANAEYRADHTVKIVLTNQVEVPGRKDFYAAAWWRVHMSDVLVPGETRELTWDIDGVVRRTPIKVGECQGCSTIGKDPSKWGSVDGSAQHVTVVLPTADHDGQEFVVTDTLTSPGQKFVCDQLLVGRIGVYTAASTWGQPQYIRFMEANVVSCDSSKATLSVTLNAGEKARFELNILVNSADPGPWSDSAVIASQDKSWEVSTRIVRRESGGNAGFDTAPTPTPAPTPEPSPSPTPTPAPSPSPTPSPSATPSASPTPSPSTTPEPTPSPSATPTPAPTPTSSTSPTPAPNPTPQHKKLAVTGVAGSGGPGRGGQRGGGGGGVLGGPPPPPLFLLVVVGGGGGGRPPARGRASGSRRLPHLGAPPPGSTPLEGPTSCQGVLV